jgi:hypothetical protein
MERKQLIIFVSISLSVFFLVVAVDVFYHDLSISHLPVYMSYLIGIPLHYSILHKQEKYQKLADEILLAYFGKKADKIEVSSKPITNHDRIEYGIIGDTFRVKFWLEGKVHKGIIDKKSKILYLKEFELMPVCVGEDVPVWKEVTKMYRSGMPQKIEFYDDYDLLHRVDYLDEKGTLGRGSWRRREGIEEYWNPETQVWESVP